MLERYVLIWLTLLSTLAFYWPAPFLATKPALWHLIGVTMFCIGALLPNDEIKQVFRRWPTVLAGTAIQYSVMPILAFTIGRLFQLPPDMMIGVIIVGCVPGAMASNVLTLMARGNVSYSVSLTTSATLLSPIVVPWTLTIALAASSIGVGAQPGTDAAISTTSAAEPPAIHVDPWETCLTLLMYVVGPVVIGHLIARQSVRFSDTMRRLGPVVANLTILWVIAVVVAAHGAKITSGAGLLVMALLSINLLGYAAGYFGGMTIGLPEAMRRALTIEVGMQNAGLGTVLAMQLFSERPAAAIAPALYTFGCMFTGAVLARLWALQTPQAD